MWSDHYHTAASVQAQAHYRIAVLAGYMPFFDEVMPTDYRARKQLWALARATELEALGKVYYSGLIDGFEASRRVARELAAFAPDVLVMMPTMAAPAGYQWEAVREMPGAPIVILNLHELDQIGSDYASQSIVAHSANVGCMMVNNVLQRVGRHAVVVTGRATDNTTQLRAQRAVRAAALAGRLRRARFGVLGSPIEGYINVTCDSEQLRSAVGCTLVDVPLSEWLDCYESVPAGSVAALGEQLRRSSTVEVSDPEELERSLRLCLALEHIAVRHELDGGTLNCRHEFAVEQPKIGMIGCLAVSYLTTQGMPFTCTGDTVTAIAMFLGKRLSGNALYCELDTIDYARGAILCANTGEGDFCQAEDRTCIRAAGKESGRRSRGCSVFYTPLKGPATAIAFTPRLASRGGHTIVAAQGSLVEAPATALGMPHALFKFEEGPVDESLSRWIAAGPTHHACVSTGSWAAQLNDIACHLGIGFEGI